MTLSTMRRSTGLLGAAAAAGLLLAGAPGAHAATDGNLETKGPLYYCSGGVPQFVVYLQALKTTETATYSSSAGNGSITRLVPDQRYGLVYSIGNLSGRNVDITFRGATSKSSITTNVKVPSSCEGLPTSRPASGWSGTAVDPGGSSSSSSSTSSAPSSSTSQSPTSGSSSASGPVVQTDQVGKGTNNTAALAMLGVLAVGGVVTVGAASRRIGNR